MARPRKTVRVCCEPDVNVFGVKGIPANEVRTMSVEMFESIRLIDYKSLNQEEAASLMGVARTTVQRLYKEGRKMIAQALLEGTAIRVEGGAYKVEETDHPACRCRSLSQEHVVVVAIKEGRIAECFGEADAFVRAIFDDDGLVRQDRIEPDQNAKKIACRRFLMSLGADTLIVGSMGKKAYPRYVQSGIATLQASGSVQDALAAFEADTLEDLKHHLTDGDCHEGDCDDEHHGEGCCQE